MTKEEIAKYIRKRRQEMGITQAELAELAGLKPLAIKRYEYGQNVPGCEALINILTALKSELKITSKKISKKV